MGISDKIVEEIVRRVRGITTPERIILIGSAALGQMTPDSDIDLLILENEPGDMRKESVRIADALRGLGYPFDIIVMPAERFDESKDIIGGIAYPANKYGRIICEAA